MDAYLRCTFGASLVGVYHRKYSKRWWSVGHAHDLAFSDNENHQTVKSLPRPLSLTNSRNSCGFRVSFTLLAWIVLETWSWWNIFFFAEKHKISTKRLRGSRRKWAGQQYENSGRFHSSVIFIVLSIGVYLSEIAKCNVCMCVCMKLALWLTVHW